jgi:peptidyl-prolyl cis-trans isomerase-like protein 2
MEKIKAEKKRPLPDMETSNQSAKKLKVFSDDMTGVQFTSGKASGSFTSTSMDVQNENTTREASQEEILQDQFKIMKSQKQKGYVRIITNLGDLLLELHCDIAPR